MFTWRTSQETNFQCSSSVWMSTVSLSHNSLVTKWQPYVYRMRFVSIPSCCPVDKHASSKSDPEQHAVVASRGRAWCVWSTREDERLWRSSEMFTPALRCKGLWWSTKREKTSKREREGQTEKGEGSEPSLVELISWGLLWHAGFQYTLLLMCLS